LEKSHIIPAFVYRWLKESSTTGVLRFGQQMNRRVQDGVKDYFLCAECEDRFEKFETPFSTLIFHPYVRDNAYGTNYDEYFRKFAVSVSWRVLAYGQQKLGLKNFRGRHGWQLNDTLETWKDYLLCGRTDIGSHSIHLVPFCGVVEHTMENVPSNINRYLMRAVEMDVVVSDENAFTYAKLGPFILVGLITYPDRAEWMNTEIFTSGYFGPGGFHAPGMLLRYLFGRCDRLAELEGGLSSRQLEVIQASYEKKRDRFETSQTCDAAVLDMLLNEKKK
jgi:hypothetical protein